MSYKTKQCFKCKKTVYTFDNKLNKFGKPQEYDDFGGNEEHWRSCPVRKAEYQARQQNTQQQGSQQFQDRETSSTYVPQGYVQSQSQPTQQIPGVGKMVDLILLAEDIKKIKETVGDMQNNIELIAMALNVPLPGREPKRASGDISEAQEGEF